MKKKTSIKRGLFRVSRQVRNGKPTDKWFLILPRAIYGERKRKLFDTVNLALEEADRLQADVLSGRLQERIRLAPKPSVLTFYSAIDKWLAEQKLRVKLGKKRASSLERDEYHFVSAKQFFGDVTLDQITAKRLVEYQVDRQDNGIKAATINSDIVAVGKILRWAHVEGLLSSVPKVERLFVRKKAPEVPNMAEVAQIVGALPAMVRPLGRLLGETGCRCGEAFNLMWDDVDLEKGLIHIRSKDGWTPKTSHSEREIPISAGLLADLQKMDRKSEYVFPGADPDKPRKRLRRAFYTAIKKVRVMRNGKPLRLTVHTLRKAYATWAAIELGLPQRVLQALLGHAPGSTVTDQYYVDVPRDALRRGVNELRL
jgi:integrase